MGPMTGGRRGYCVPAGDRPVGETPAPQPVTPVAWPALGLGAGSRGVRGCGAGWCGGRGRGAW